MPLKIPALTTCVTQKFILSLFNRRDVGEGFIARARIFNPPPTHNAEETGHYRHSLQPIRMRVRMSASSTAFSGISQHFSGFSRTVQVFCYVIGQIFLSSGIQRPECDLFHKTFSCYPHEKESGIASIKYRFYYYMKVETWAIVMNRESAVFFFSTFDAEHLEKIHRRQ